MCYLWRSGFQTVPRNCKIQIIFHKSFFFCKHCKRQWAAKPWAAGTITCSFVRLHQRVKTYVPFEGRIGFCGWKFVNKTVGFFSGCVIGYECITLHTGGASGGVRITTGALIWCGSTPTSLLRFDSLKICQVGCLCRVYIRKAKQGF